MTSPWGPDAGLPGRRAGLSQPQGQGMNSSSLLDLQHPVLNLRRVSNPGALCGLLGGPPPWPGWE